jgi:hypothetical protein
MGVAATALEIAAHPVAQQLGLADVENPVLSITQQIAAGFGRHLLQAGLELGRLLDQDRRAGGRCQGWSCGGVGAERGARLRERPYRFKGIVFGCRFQHR